jgi:hypothetical protein
MLHFLTDAGPWQQLKGGQGCVTAINRDSVDVDTCVDVSDPLVAAALAQQFREVDMPSAPFGVAESLAHPGMCVVVGTNGQPGACACANLALAVCSMLAARRSLYAVRHVCHVLTAVCSAKEQQLAGAAYCAESACH